MIFDPYSVHLRSVTQCSQGFAQSFHDFTQCSQRPIFGPSMTSFFAPLLDLAIGGGLCRGFQASKTGHLQRAAQNDIEVSS